MLEIVIFTGNFLFSKNGLQAITALEQENNNLCNEIAQMKKTLHAMEKEIAQWNNYPFYTEQAARERLNMCRPNETIYYMF